MATAPNQPEGGAGAADAETGGAAGKTETDEAGATGPSADAAGAGDTVPDRTGRNRTNREKR